MARPNAIVLAVVALLVTQPVAGQTGETWSSVAKIINGRCGDGATGRITEAAGKLHLTLTYPNGKQYADFDVPLAADGSGKADFKGSMGPTVFEVPAGKGKRVLKTTQVQGVCQWTWVPQ